MGLLDRFFGPPSKNKFAKLLRDAIRRAGETSEIIYDQEGFRLHNGGDESRIVFLGNAYQEYCSAPTEKREETLSRWVRHWFSSQQETPEDFADVKPDLFPVFRSRCYFDMVRLQLEIQGHKPPDWPYQILGEDFAISVVYDRPESMQQITQSDLDNWGVTFYEAMEVARHNLEELKQPFVGPESGQGLYLSAANDGYDATRIILLDLIRRFQLKGTPVAMVPNRATLAVAGEDDEDALKGMIALTKEGLQQPRPISGIALRLEGDDWMPWLPAPEHRLFDEFRMLQIQSHGQNYAEQESLLGKLHEKTGEDIFVANYGALKDKSGRVITYSVWGDGVDTLLPRCDVVAFMRKGNEPLMVGFDKVLERVGHLMEPVEIYPPRYRVREFPTEEDLAALTDAAV